MADEVIARAAVELVPKVGNFGAQVAAEVRKQMQIAAKTIDDAAKKATAGTARTTKSAVDANTKTVTDGAKRQAKAVADGTKTATQAVQDGARKQTKAVKDSADESVKQSRQSNKRLRDDAQRTTVSIGKSFGGLRGTVSQSIKGIGPAFAGLLGATALGGVIKESVDLEATFSQTMNTMAAVAGVPAAGIKELSRLALKMGADTTFSANDAAEAMLELAKGGLTAAQIKAGALSATLTLAAAGGVSLADAGTVMVQALTTFNLRAEDSASVAAALAGGANASTSSIESLSLALSQVGPGAKTAGLTLQDTVGVLAAFENNGLKGSDAGTSLKTALTNLVPSSKKAKTLMDNLGLSFIDAAGNVKPIVDIAQQLQDKIGTLTQADQIQALNTIFGSDAARAGTVLMKEGAAGIQKFIDATKDANAANAVAAARMSGTAGAIEAFKGSVETAKLQLGQFLAPAIQAGLKLLGTAINGIVPAAQKLAPAFKGVVDLVGKGDFTKNFREAFNITEDSPIVATILKTRDAVIALAGVVANQLIPGLVSVLKFFRDNDTALKALVITLGIVTTLTWAHTIAMRAETAGGFLKFFATYIKSLKIVAATLKVAAAAQWAMNAAQLANPVGLIVLAVIALIAILVIAYKKSETFRNIVHAVGDACATAGKAIWSALVTAFHAVIDAAQATWKALTTAFNAVKGAIATAISAVVGAFNTVVGAVGTVVNAVRSVWNGIIAAISGPVTAVINVLQAIWARIMPILVLPFYIARKTIAVTIEGIKAVFMSLVTWAQTVFGVAWKVIQAVIVQPLQAAWRLVQSVWKTIVNAFQAAASWVGGVFSKAWGKVAQVLSGPLSAAKARIEYVWALIRAGFNRAKDWVLGAFSTAWGALKARLTGPIDAVRKAIATALGAAKGGVQWVFQQAVNGIGRIWDTLKDKAKAPIRFVIDTVLNNGLISAFNWIAGKFDAPKIPAIPLPKGFAAGGFTGRLPGPPSAVDNLVGYNRGGMFGLAGGEFVVNAKATQKHLPELAAMNGGYANGGLIGTLKNAANSALSAGKSFAGDVGDFIGSPVNWLKDRFAGPLKKMDELGNSSMAQVVKAVPNKIANVIQDKAKALVDSLFGASEGARGVGKVPGGGAGKVVNFRGARLNQRTIAMLLSAEAALGKTFHITQGSYSTSVSASGSTHAGGGAMDTDNAGAGWTRAQNALRNVGFASWWRHPWQGPWNDHIHSIAIGDNTASAAARAQVADFLRGGDGLKGYADGAWNVLQTHVARVHAGEMVVPQGPADEIRRVLSGNSSTGSLTGGSGAQVVELSEADRRLLRAAANPAVYLDSTRVDKSMSTAAMNRKRVR